MSDLINQVLELVKSSPGISRPTIYAILGDNPSTNRMLEEVVDMGLIDESVNLKTRVRKYSVTLNPDLSVFLSKREEIKDISIDELSKEVTRVVRENGSLRGDEIAARFGDLDNLPSAIDRSIKDLGVMESWSFASSKTTYVQSGKGSPHDLEKRIGRSTMSYNINPKIISGAVSALRLIVRFYRISGCGIRSNFRSHELFLESMSFLIRNREVIPEWNRLHYSTTYTAKAV